MDRQSLIEGLQRAFDGDDRQRATNDASDVEYKGDTNTLYVNKQKTFDMNSEKEASFGQMSEEELFARLHDQRR